MSKLERIALLCVLCLAVVLRFAYLDRGLPYQLNSDEYHHTNEAKRVLRGQAFEPGPLGLYPNFFATLIAAVHGPVSFFPHNCR